MQSLEVVVTRLSAVEKVRQGASITNFLQRSDEVAGRKRGSAAAVAIASAAGDAQRDLQRRLLLDVVVRERAAVLELLPGEDEALLVNRGALLVLDLLLHVLDRVRRLDVQRDGLDRKSVV